MIDIVKVIAKVCNGEMTLFFPEYEQRYGFITCWTLAESHGDASIEYYREALHPLNTQEEEEAVMLINTYGKLYGVLTQRTRRQSTEQKQTAWGNT